MRFVAAKTFERLIVMMLHKSRDLLVRQRLMLINALHGHLAKHKLMVDIGAGGPTFA